VKHATSCPRDVVVLQHCRRRRRQTQEAAPAAAGDVAAPSGDDARKVVDYYYRGKGKGPVLIELKPCLKIDTEEGSANRYECSQPVDGAVKPGSFVYAWTSWLVPEGDDYSDVTVQFAQAGAVKGTKELKLSSAFRTRTYKGMTLGAGKWMIKAMRGDQEIGHAEVEVK
jgi:hypothetical protein